MTDEPKTPMPQRFRKKPVVIEAMKFDGTERSQAVIVTWADGRASGWFDDRYHLEIRTLEGVMRADVGDWIIRGVLGEFYPCKPDLFEAAYEPADTPTRDEAAELRAAVREWAEAHAAVNAGMDDDVSLEDFEARCVRFQAAQVELRRLAASEGQP